MQKILMVLVGVFLICGVANAGLVKVKAKGLAPYGMFASGDIRRHAVEDAKQKALRKYAANFDSARFKIFETELPEMLQQIDMYVVDYQVIDGGKNKTSKNYEVVLEASIDATRIEQVVSRASEVIAGPAGGEVPYIAFVMVARQMESTRIFKSKKTDVQQAAQSTDESTSIGADGLSMKTSVEVTGVQTTGGSVERKAAEAAYRVFSTPDANSAMTEIFAKAGFEPVDPRDLEIDLLTFENEFAAGAVISRATRKDAIDKCREFDVSFFTVGNMDVGTPDIDPATGMSRVYVKVTATVTDLRKRLPRAIASVRGVQYAGIGPDPFVAQQNALNTAAEKSAADIVDQLRSKGVQAN